MTTIAVLAGGSLHAQERSLETDTTPVDFCTKLNEILCPKASSYIIETTNDQFDHKSTSKPTTDLYVINIPMNALHWKLANFLRQIDPQTESPVIDESVSGLLAQSNSGFIFHTSAIGGQFMLKVTPKILEKNSDGTLNVTNFEGAINDLDLMIKMCGAPYFPVLNFAAQDPNNFYTEMNSCSISLSSLLRTEGKLDVKLSQFFMAEILVALSSLNENGIVLPSIRADNIFIDNDGHIVLLNFENSLRFPSHPPLVKIHVSLHSVACLLHEMLVGRKPRWEAPGVPFEEENLDPIAKQLIFMLVSHDARRRQTPNELRSHPFFRDINWDDITARKVLSPYVPGIQPNRGDITQYTDLSRLPKSSPKLAPKTFDPCLNYRFCSPERLDSISNMKSGNATRNRQWSRYADKLYGACSTMEDFQRYSRLDPFGDNFSLSSFVDDDWSRMMDLIAEVIDEDDQEDGYGMTIPQSDDPSSRIDDDPSISCNSSVWSSGSDLNITTWSSLSGSSFNSVSPMSSQSSSSPISIFSSPLHSPDSSYSPWDSLPQHLLSSMSISEHEISQNFNSLGKATLGLRISSRVG